MERVYRVLYFVDCRFASTCGTSSRDLLVVVDLKYVLRSRSQMIVATLDDKQSRKYFDFSVQYYDRVLGQERVTKVLRMMFGGNLSDVSFGQNEKVRGSSAVFPFPRKRRRNLKVRAATTAVSNGINSQQSERVNVCLFTLHSYQQQQQQQQDHIIINITTVL
jgi:hypothetical protein